MLSENANEKLFTGFANQHYLSRFLSFVRLSPFWRALALACLSYFTFLLCAAAYQWQQVVSSFLHKWQVNFSITIFFGLWFGDLALRSLRPWLEHSGLMFAIKDNEFINFAGHTIERLRSKYSSLMAAPLIVAGLTIACFIANNSPNDFFPYPGYTPAFVYAVFVEMCVLMLHLLGATGFWLLYVFTKAAKELSNIESVNYELVDEKSMKYLSDTVLRLCIYLFIIIASAMPAVAYVVFAFRDLPFVLMLGTVFGVAAPTIGLFLSFFGPTYYLHKMMAKAKDRRLVDLREEIRLCEQRLKRLGSKELKHKDDDDEVAARCRSLREQYLDAQRRCVWPFNLASILKLTGSSMLPIASFVAQRLVHWP